MSITLLHEKYSSLCTNLSGPHFCFFLEEIPNDVFVNFLVFKKIVVVIYTLCPSLISYVYILNGFLLMIY